MQKIAIIGGGIIGLTLANYLDPEQFEVTLFDEGTGQATRASAGIISPWLSKRRNQRWYRLAREGAAFFPQLVRDFELDASIYERCGTLIFRAPEKLPELFELAKARKMDAPEMGDIAVLSAAEVHARCTLLRPSPALFVSGGGRLDGAAYLAHLTTRAKQRGVTIINEKATVKRQDKRWLVTSATKNILVEQVVAAVGPHLPALLAPLSYTVDIRAQKGQLLVFQTPYKESQSWPVVMFDGEGDLIPFTNGQLLIGATHENDATWNLEPTKAAYTQLTEGAAAYLCHPEEMFRYVTTTKVGTRAYTSDFAPFFGPLPKDPTFLVASGLGSSGLTTGPYIGYLLAQYLMTNTWQAEHYQKPIETYIKKEPAK